MNGGIFARKTMSYIHLDRGEELHWLFLYQLENDAENSLLVVAPAIDFEGAYFAGILHMGTDAGTYVVVADAHQAEGGTGIVGQLAGIYLGGQIVACGKLVGHGQALRNHVVHPSLNLLHLLFGRAFGQWPADFALLALDVCVARTFASEHPYHRLIQ